MINVPERLPDDEQGRQVWAVPKDWVLFWKSPGEPAPPHKADILMRDAALDAARERLRKVFAVADLALKGSDHARKILSEMRSEYGPWMTPDEEERPSQAGVARHD